MRRGRRPPRRAGGGSPARPRAPPSTREGPPSRPEAPPTPPRRTPRPPRPATRSPAPIARSRGLAGRLRLPPRFPGSPRTRSTPARVFSGRLRPDPRGHDLVRIAHRLAALDLVRDVHTLHDLAPHRVLLVEEAGLVEADEELRVGRRRGAAARPGACAAHRRFAVEPGLEVRQVRAAGAGSGRIARLRHEALDD